MSYTVIETAEKSVIMAIPIIFMGIIGITMLRYNVKLLKREFEEDGK